MKKTDLTSFIPPDKSSLIRQVLFSILTEEKVEVVYGEELPEDIKSAFSALKSFSKSIRIEKNIAIISGRASEPQNEVCCGNSGTVMHILMGISCLYGWDVEFSGDDSLMARDHSAFYESARLYVKERFVVTELEKQSAQLKSFHLLAMLKNGGKLSYKWKTRNSTEVLLEKMGVRVIDDGNEISVDPVSELKGYSIVAEKDPSSAFIAVCAALIAGVDVTVNGVLDEELRLVPFAVLNDVGYQVNIIKDEGGVKVETGSGSKEGMDIKIREEKVAQVIDEVPFLAYMSVRNDRGFKVENAHWLRNKESDRIYETVKLLSGFYKTEEKDDGFSVSPEKREVASQLPHSHDHRMEMLAALIAADKGLNFNAGKSCKVSFPKFVEMMNYLKR